MLGAVANGSIPCGSVGLWWLSEICFNNYLYTLASTKGSQSVLYLSGMEHFSAVHNFSAHMCKFEEVLIFVLPPGNL
jgi:hypothetical protein